MAKEVHNPENLLASLQLMNIGDRLWTRLRRAPGLQAIWSV